MKPHRIMLLIGRRGSGKSVLLKDLLYNMRDRVDYAMAMCPTVESAAMLRSCLPGSSVFDRFVGHKVEALIELAQDLATRNKVRNFLLVLDDVMYDKGICRTPHFRNLFYNGRHYRITCILLLQYLVDLPPDLRAQIDYVFACREPILANRVKLFKMFFGVFATQEEFDAVLERCTQNYEVLCLDNTLSSTGPQDCVCWYKAEFKLPDFKLCAQVFHTLSERHARQSGSTLSDEAGESGAGSTQSKRGVKITVTKDDGEEGGEKEER
jgi:GTPase SAR1 family protein